MATNQLTSGVGAVKPTLSFGTAMKMLPKFDGIEHNDLNTFENTCDFIFNNIDDSIKALVLQALVSTLSGKAGEVIKYKAINSIGELKAILKASFYKGHSVSYLQLKLNSIEQERGEGINNYASRIERAYHELTYAQVENRSVGTAKIISEVVKGEALSIFINGLITPIRNIVKARGVKTLEEAVSIALEEEQAYESHRIKSNKNTYKSEHKNNNFSRNNNSNYKSNFNYQPRPNREQIPFIKQEQSEVKIICAYCKKNNHHISECRKLRFKDQNKGQHYKSKYNNSNLSTSNSNRVRTVNEINEHNENNNVKLATKLTNEHIICYSNNLVEGSDQFLIDSGSDMNLIKISKLKGNIEINEGSRRLLRGINDNAVCTIGTIKMKINIGQEDFLETFEVVHNSFPIPRTGILGKTFLKGNGVIIDMQDDMLIIPDKSIKVPARSELMIAIETPNALENKVLLLESQEVNNDITLSNTVGISINNQLITSIINTSENIVKIGNINIDNLRWEEFEEKNIFTIKHNTKAYEIHRESMLDETLQLDHLNSEEKINIKNICNEYSDLFYLKNEYLTFTETEVHNIITPEQAVPINIRPYRLPMVHKQEINRQVNEMLDKQIIKPSTLPWNFPIVIVPKKGDTKTEPKLRICIDYRKLNEITVGDAYPLANINTILDQLGKSKYFSTLDLADGYHQIKINPEHTHKTAFSTPEGHFEFLRLGFGLTSAPATFSRMMKKVLMGLEGTRCFAYLDDIIIYASSLDDHEVKLREVFQRLREHSLKLKAQKCQFLRNEVMYLGHIITEKGIKPDPEKTNAVKNFPTPHNQTTVKSFIGLANYYRRFIPKFAQIAKPMTLLVLLLKKESNFVWNDACDIAFRSLKEKLLTEPILQYPDFNKQFILSTDASNFAIGSVLSQGESGQDLPIAYASRTLSKAEINYSTIEKELLAIVWSIKNFRPYLYGQKFAVVTDKVYDIDHRVITITITL